MRQRGVAGHLGLGFEGGVWQLRQKNQRGKPAARCTRGRMCDPQLSGQGGTVHTGRQLRSHPFTMVSSLIVALLR